MNKKSILDIALILTVMAATRHGLWGIESDSSKRLLRNWGLTRSPTIGWIRLR